MRLARRGFILGGAALMSGCATAAARPVATAAAQQLPPAPAIQVARPPEVITAQLNSTRPLDPRGSVRKELMDRALAEGATADEAEAMAIGQIQQLGSAVLTDWARAKQVESLQQAQQQTPGASRHLKKK